MIGILVLDWMLLALCSVCISIFLMDGCNFTYKTRIFHRRFLIKFTMWRVGWMFVSFRTWAFRDYAVDWWSLSEDERNYSSGLNCCWHCVLYAFVFSTWMAVISRTRRGSFVGVFLSNLQCDEWDECLWVSDSSSGGRIYRSVDPLVLDSRQRWWVLHINLYQWLQYFYSNLSDQTGLIYRYRGLDEGVLNLGNGHGFIIKEYTLHWCEAFWGSPKQSHENLCSKWTISYHCGESCSANMVSKSCPKLNHVNRLANPQTSNKVLWASKA